MLLPNAEGGFEPAPIKYPWPLTKCLVGLNARADGLFEEHDYQVINVSKMEAVKIGLDVNETAISKLREINSSLFIMARLYYPLGQRKVEPEESIGRVVYPRIGAQFRKITAYQGEIMARVQSPDLTNPFQCFFVANMTTQRVRRIRGISNHTPLSDYLNGLINQS